MSSLAAVKVWFMKEFADLTSFEPPVLWALVEGVLKHNKDKPRQVMLNACAKTLDDFLHADVKPRATELATKVMDRIDAEARGGGAAHDDVGHAKDEQRSEAPSRGADSHNDRANDEDRHSRRRTSDDDDKHGQRRRRHARDGSDDDEDNDDEDDLRRDRSHKRERRSSRDADDHSHRRRRSRSRSPRRDYRDRSRHDHYRDERDRDRHYREHSRSRDYDRRRDDSYRRRDDRYGSDRARGGSARQDLRDRPNNVNGAKGVSDAARIAPEKNMQPRGPPRLATGDPTLQRLLPPGMRANIPPPPMLPHGLNLPLPPPHTIPPPNFGLRGGLTAMPVLASALPQRGGGGGPGSTVNLRRDRGAAIRAPPNSIMVTDVPRDKLKLNIITEHFQQYGEISGCTVDASGGRATVSFRHHSAKLAALRSTEAIFNNRYVRVVDANLHAGQKRGAQHAADAGQRDGAAQAALDAGGRRKVVKLRREVGPDAKKRPGSNKLVTEAAKKLMAEQAEAGDDDAASGAGAPPRKVRVTGRDGVGAVVARESEIQEKSKAVRAQMLDKQKELMGKLGAKDLDAKERSSILSKLKQLQKLIDESLAQEKARIESQAKLALEAAARKKAAEEARLKAVQARAEARAKAAEEKQARLDKELADIAEANKGPEMPDKTSDGGDATDAAVADDGAEKASQSDAEKLAALVAHRDQLKRDLERAKKQRGTGRTPRGSMKLDLRSTTVRLTELPETLRSDDALRAAVSKYGKVEEVALDKSNSSASVRFDVRRSAEAVVNAQATLGVKASVDEKIVRQAKKETESSAQTNVAADEKKEESDAKETEASEAKNEQGDTADAMETDVKKEESETATPMETD